MTHVRHLRISRIQQNLNYIKKGAGFDIVDDRSVWHPESPFRWQWQKKKLAEEYPSRYGNYQEKQAVRRGNDPKQIQASSQSDSKQKQKQSKTKMKLPTPRKPKDEGKTSGAMTPTGSSSEGPQRFGPRMETLEEREARWVIEREVERERRRKITGREKEYPREWSTFRKRFVNVFSAISWVYIILASAAFLLLIGTSMAVGFLNMYEDIKEVGVFKWIPKVLVAFVSGVITAVMEVAQNLFYVVGMRERPAESYDVARIQPAKLKESDVDAEI